MGCIRRDGKSIRKISAKVGRTYKAEGRRKLKLKSGCFLPIAQCLLKIGRPVSFRLEYELPCPSDFEGKKV
jgi:hypothetical protein